MKVSKIVRSKEKSKEIGGGNRGKNSTATQIKPGFPGRVKGVPNKKPPLSLISDEMKALCIKKFEDNLRAGKDEYILWLLSRMIPPAKPEPERTIINLEFDDLDLSQLDGIRSAGVRVAQALAKGEISLEEGQQVLKILQAQNSLVYNELIENLIKFAREHRNDTDLVGSGNTMMTEEEFNKLYDASMRRPIASEGDDDTK